MAPRFSARTLALLATLALAACGTDERPRPAGGGEDPPPPPQTKPRDPEPPVDGCTALALASDRLSFRTAGVGSPATRSIAVWTRNGGACHLTLEVAGDGFSLPASEVRVEAEATRHLEVVFDPAVEGRHEGELRIRAGDEVHTVALDGEGVLHCIEPAPAAIDFGEMEALCGLWDPVDFDLRNACENPVLLHHLQFGMPDEGWNDERAFDFALLHPPPTPYVVEPGEVLRFGVVFQTDALGLREDAISIWDGPEAIVVPLHGTAVRDLVPHEMHYHQDPAPLVDRLFIIDDHPATSLFLQDGAIEHLVRALLDAQARSQRARWAVTTTSRLATPGCVGSGADGRLLPLDGGPRWLDNPVEVTDEVVAAFRDLLTVPGCSGAANEALAGAVRALELAQVEDDPAHPERDDGNTGFLRDGAPLVLTFIAARDDASAGLVEAWYERLVAAHPSIARIDAIAGPLAGDCAGAMPAPRLKELAERGRGTFVDLCAGNWGSSVGPPPGNGSWPRTTFYLATTPFDGDGDGSLANDIEVRVNGTPVPEVVDGTPIWTYREETNAVVFSVDPMPPDGGEVVITLRMPACMLPT